MTYLASTPQRHLLLIDPDREWSDALRSLLGSRGFRVSNLDDESALKALLEDSIDAVVLDISPEQGSGWNVFQQIRNRHPDVLLIVVSASMNVSGAVQAMRGGAFDVLEKPVGVAELEARLHDGLSREPPAPKTLRRPQPPQGERALGRRRDGLERMLGNSPALARVREQVRGIARFNQVATLVIGETGSGKERVAEALHDLSAPDKPFICINCAAIPDSLFESELFGHEAGAFTGARSAKPGLFETAGEGTILLDEVGEMALSMQPKLLRVLQNRTFRRVGGSRDIELRARIVSATNRKLSASRQDGVRSDLYFRLAGFTIVLPPLRHRIEDIELLASQFLLEFSSQYPGVPTRVGSVATELLVRHSWPGNVRELKRVVEQAAMLSEGASLEPSAVERALDERNGCDEFGVPAESGSFRIERSLQSEPESSPRSHNDGHQDLGLNELQERVIVDAYENHERNLTRAARALRIPRTTLRDRLKRYGRI